MDWLSGMNGAMDYIEANLAGEISYDKAAQIACCSTYHFQRMFSFITGIPLSEYIRRRRLTAAAFEIQKSEIKIIDAAHKYGYESPEAFSRAFRKLHGVAPAAARSEGVALKAYPKMTFSIIIKGNTEMDYRIEKLSAFELCGVSAVIDGKKMTPPKFIRQTYKNGKLDNLYDDLDIRKIKNSFANEKPYTPNLVFAIYDYKKDDTFSYMICHNKPAGGAPPGYETLSVPALTWVVFTSPKDPKADPAVQCKRAWSRVPEWFAMSEYEQACGPQLEKGFEFENLEFLYEVWIPIVKKNAD